MTISAFQAAFNINCRPSPTVVVVVVPDISQIGAVTDEALDVITDESLNPIIQD